MVGQTTEWTNTALVVEGKISQGRKNERMQVSKRLSYTQHTLAVLEQAILGANISGASLAKTQQITFREPMRGHELFS
jgi:hypothetical protein